MMKCSVFRKREQGSVEHLKSGSTALSNRVLIMMLFIRAEREAEWPLHLLVVKLMMPYFFSAGHLNYARYGLYYLSSMERLPDDILVQFMEGRTCKEASSRNMEWDVV